MSSLTVDLNSLISRCLKCCRNQYKCGKPSNCIIIERILTVARVQRWQNSNVLLQVFVFLRKICKVLTPNPQAKPCRFCTFLMNKSRYDTLALLADILLRYESRCGTRQANIRGTNQNHFSEASESKWLHHFIPRNPCLWNLCLHLVLPLLVNFQKGRAIRGKNNTRITWLAYHHHVTISRNDNIERTVTQNQNIGERNICCIE